MKFSYTTFPTEHPLTREKGKVYRPLIPIDLKFDSAWVSELLPPLKYINALIDSGADYNYAPMEIGNLLKIDFINKPPSPTRGINGEPVNVYFSEVSINIGGIIFESSMGFGETFPFILLGGSGFFNHWKVKMEYPKDIELKYRG